MHRRITLGEPFRLALREPQLAGLHDPPLAVLAFTVDGFSRLHAPLAPRSIVRTIARFGMKIASATWS